MPSISDELTVRDLRRRWKPIKERLNAVQDNHPTAIRVHRVFSWMARVEELEDGVDLDVALICRWVAFNALYGQWNEASSDLRWSSGEKSVSSYLRIMSPAGRKRIRPSLAEQPN